MSPPEVVFKGERFDLLNVDVTLKGKHVKRVMVSHPGAVVILPLLDPRTLLLIHNVRYSINESLWELPAGTLEPGEERLACARRELIEETGYQASHMQELLHFYSSPGFCNEKLFVFLAKELTFVGQDLDEGEEITVVPTPLEKALEMIRSHTIHDAKTIAALLYYHHFVTT